MADIPDTVKSVLESGSLTRLIGLKEGQDFEAKRTPYSLETPVGRIELAKDVCSFANAIGGWILVGLDTSPQQDEATDIVTDIRPIKESAFPIGQYTGIIRDYVFPRIPGLQVMWWKSTDAPDEGLGAILIPNCDRDLRPFLTTRVIEDGNELPQLVFGIARRVGAHSIPSTVMEVHRAVTQGTTSHAQRLSRIEAKLDALIEPPMAIADVSGQGANVQAEMMRQRLNALSQE